MHKAKAIIIHCIDFRFVDAIRKWMEKERLMNEADVVSVAGAVQNIVSPKFESDREFIFRQIDIGKRLHGIEEVVLMNHTDCGAYGGASAFFNVLEEEDKHELDLREARAIILSKFPEFKVRLMLAKIERNGNISFNDVS